jgi:hypothetical protein
MAISFLMNRNDYRTDDLLSDVQTWSHFFSRSACEMHEEGADHDDEAGLTRLTVKFRDPRDEADFWLWRGISHRGCRS